MKKLVGLKRPLGFFFHIFKAFVFFTLRTLSHLSDSMDSCFFTLINSSAKNSSVTSGIKESKPAGIFHRPQRLFIYLGSAPQEG